MPLQIPDEQIPAIIKIKELSRHQSAQLIKALTTAPIESKHEDLAKRIAEQVQSIPLEDLIAVLGVVYELYFVREFANVNQSRFLDDLIESIRDSNNPALTLATDDVADLKKRFGKLLSLEAISVISKSARLQRDGERLYCTSKILSDLRPVFKDNPRVKPSGAVITHTLKLDYHKGADVKQFDVVLDIQDLIELKEVLDRAIAKDKTLSELLDSFKLPRLGI